MPVGSWQCSFDLTHYNYVTHTTITPRYNWMKGEIKKKHSEKKNPNYEFASMILTTFNGNFEQNTNAHIHNSISIAAYKSCPLFGIFQMFVRLLMPKLFAAITECFFWIVKWNSVSIQESRGAKCLFQRSWKIKCEAENQVDTFIQNMYTFCSIVDKIRQKPKWTCQTGCQIQWLPN